MTETYSNRTTTNPVLSASIALGASACTVNSTASYPATGDFRVVIGSERIRATVLNATTLTLIERGAESTTAAAHAAGAEVAHILTKGALDAILAQTQAAAQAASDPAGSAAAAQSAATAVANAKVASVSGTAPITSSGGTTPAIGISAASGAAAGSMSAAHYSKLDALSSAPVTGVSGTAPIASSGGTTPAISITAATGTDPGSMSAADKAKLDGVETAADVTDWANVATALGTQAAAANKVFVSDASNSGAMATSVTGLTLTDPTLAGAPVITATSMSATGNARARAYSAVANVQTADATVTSLYTWTVLDEAASLVVAELLADLSDGSATASYVRRARVKRDGGTVTVGTVEDSYTSEEAAFAACDVTIDNDTSTGRVRVTGIAATTIDWGGIVSRLEVSHA